MKKIDLIYKNKYVESNNQIAILKNEIIHLQSVINVDEKNFKELDKYDIFFKDRKYYEYGPER